MKARLASILASTVMVCGSVQASVVIMTFDDLPASSWNIGNLEYQGFRISPSTYYDIRPATTDPNDFYYPYNSQWLGWSNGMGALEPSDVCDGYLGPNCLTSAGTKMYFDHYGDRFSVLAFDAKSIILRGDVDWWITTSGTPVPFQVVYEDLEHVVLNDPRWRNITWISFASVMDGDVIRGMDNLQFDVATRTVPEPGTALLVSLGLGLLATRRKRLPQ